MCRARTIPPASNRRQKDTLPFHPYFTVKDGFALACFLVFYAWFVFYIPNYLGHADNYIEANPLKTPPHIVPEWYYLPFYAILRSIPSKLGGFFAMFGAVLILAALPWLDTASQIGRLPPAVRIFFWIFVVGAVLLGYIGSQPPEGIYVIAARILTAYYFLHFLVILPLLGKYEKPKLLPASIADAVLGKSGKTEATDTDSMHAREPGQ